MKIIIIFKRDTANGDDVLSEYERRRYNDCDILAIKSNEVDDEFWIIKEPLNCPVCHSVRYEACFEIAKTYYRLLKWYPNIVECRKPDL